MTSTKTKRLKPSGLKNRIDFECEVDRCSFIEIELRLHRAARDARIATAQGYNADVIAELEAEQKAKLALCEKFATEHRAELLADEKRSKSAETPLSRYGFRTGNPSLKLLRKLSWEKVVEKLKEMHLTHFLRASYEVDKQKLLTAQEDAPLAEIGVRIARGEGFFIEPKLDHAETLKAEAV